MLAPTPSRVLALGRWWSADELDAIARHWRAELLERRRDRDDLLAAALPATVEGVALFAALISLPAPLVLLVADPRAWRTEPAMPAGTPVVLPPALAHLVPDAERLGLIPLVLGEPRRTGAAPPLGRLSASGVVIFTSGSTGLPRAVFRSMPTLLAVSRARIEALGLRPGAGILMGVSLASGQA